LRTYGTLHLAIFIGYQPLSLTGQRFGYSEDCGDDLSFSVNQIGKVEDEEASCFGLAKTKMA
jgi:hypothetical protein